MQAGVVTWDIFDDYTINWQLNAWETILSRWGFKTEWVCLTDSDCFLYPVDDDDVASIVKRFEDEDTAGLAIYVSTFGSSGLKTTPALQIESFLKRAHLDSYTSFTANYILRPSMMKGYADPTTGNIIDTNKEVIDRGLGKRKGPMDVLRLNHYSVRSEEDFKRKVQRGWEMHNWNPEKGDQALYKWKKLNRNEVFDDSMLRRFVPKLKQALLAR